MEYLTIVESGRTHHLGELNDWNPWRKRTYRVNEQCNKQLSEYHDDFRKTHKEKYYECWKGKMNMVNNHGARDEWVGGIMPKERSWSCC